MSSQSVLFSHAHLHALPMEECVQMLKRTDKTFQLFISTLVYIVLVLVLVNVVFWKSFAILSSFSGNLQYSFGHVTSTTIKCHVHFM